MAQRCVWLCRVFYPWREFCGREANAAVQSVCQVTVPPMGRATKEPEGEGAGGEADGGGDGGVGGSRRASTASSAAVRIP